MWLHLLEDGSAIGGTVFDIFGIIDRVWASALIPSLDHHSVARGNRCLCCITVLVSAAFVSLGGPLPRRNLSHRPLLEIYIIVELCQPLPKMN